MDMDRTMLKEADEKVKKRELDHHKIEVDFQHQVKNKDQSANIQSDLTKD